MVCSCRERHFDLYVDCLEAMVPLFFATNHQHYSRWLTVHIHDLRTLPQSIKNEFQKGNFVVTRPSRRFSAIPVDQAQEQNNKVIKGCGGVIGLTESPHTMKKFMACAHEISRVLRQFKDEYLFEGDDDLGHHTETPSDQKNFMNDVSKLEHFMVGQGNPFLESSSKLISIHSKDVCVEDRVANLRSLEANGRKKFNEFKQSVFILKKKSIHDPMKQNNCSIFKLKKTKANPKKEKI